MRKLNGGSRALAGAKALQVCTLLQALLCAACPTTDKSPNKEPDDGMQDEKDAGDTPEPEEDAGAEPDVDAGTPDAGGEDAGPMGIAALDLCGELDTRWMLASDDPVISDNRTLAWASDIAFAFLDGFVADCRVNQIGYSLTEDQVVSYQNSLIVWNMTFFGCPLPSADPLTYALTETGAEAVYTSTDQAQLSMLYVAGVEKAIADVGGDPLSPDTIASIQAKLAELAAESDVVPSDNFSNDTCEP